MGQVSRIHVEIDFSGEPLLADFAEESGDKAEQGSFVWKEGCDAGSAFEFLIDAFDGVACAQAALVGCGEPDLPVHRGVEQLRVGRRTLEQESLLY